MERKKKHTDEDRRENENRKFKRRSNKIFVSKMAQPADISGKY